MLCFNDYIVLFVNYVTSRTYFLINKFISSLYSSSGQIESNLKWYVRWLSKIIIYYRAVIFKPRFNETFFVLFCFFLHYARTIHFFFLAQTLKLFIPIHLNRWIQKKKKNRKSVLLNRFLWIRVVDAHFFFWIFVDWIFWSSYPSYRYKSRNRLNPRKR